MRNGVVSIINNADLWKYFSEEVNTRTTRLTQMIKRDYREFYNKELDIGENSLMVEIWAHIYYEYYILSIGSMFRTGWVKRLIEKLVKPSQSIDCGERGGDRNRRLWDILARYRSAISKLLPEGIADRIYLKE